MSLFFVKNLERKNLFFEGVSNIKALFVSSLHIANFTNMNIFMEIQIGEVFHEEILTRLNGYTAPIVNSAKCYR